MKYHVYNHHDFWQWDTEDTELMDSDIVFMWADWIFRDEIQKLHMLGKKIVCYEHGFGSMFDYELNNRETIADGYLVLGQESKDSLVRAGVDSSKILITGNPIYDDIKKIKQRKVKKEVLFIALHWSRDLSLYNQTKFDQLRSVYPQFNWTAKVTDKTGDLRADKKWYNDVEGNILEDIKKKLPNYDMVFTPRHSTFESIARLMGIPVYVIDKEETYKQEGEHEAIPFNNTYLRIGDKLPEQKPFNMDEYIKRPSLSFDLILEWVKTL